MGNREQVIAQWWRGLDADDRSVARQVLADGGSMPSALTRSLTRAGVLLGGDLSAPGGQERTFAMPDDVARFVTDH